MIFSSVARAKLYHKHSLQRLNIFPPQSQHPPVVHLNPVTRGSCKQCPVVLGAWKNKTVKKKGCKLFVCDCSLQSNDIKIIKCMACTHGFLIPAVVPVVKKGCGC